MGGNAHPDATTEAASPQAETEEQPKESVLEFLQNHSVNLPITETPEGGVAVKKVLTVKLYDIIKVLYTAQAFAVALDDVEDDDEVMAQLEADTGIKNTE